MTADDLEFAISQHLDGMLPPDEVIALEARLAQDPAARVLYEEYRSVATLLAAPAALPAVAWEKLSSRIATAVAEEVEQFAFKLSQFSDGTLAAEDSPAVEQRLATDSVAQASLEQSYQLARLLKTAPPPDVRWERLAMHLSATVADAAEPQPIKLFSKHWVRGIGGLAIAASVFVASAIGFRGYLKHPVAPSSEVAVVSIKHSVVASASTTPIDVQIGISDPAAAPGVSVAEVSVGAGPDGALDEAPDGIIARSPRSLIASTAAPVQDGDSKDQQDPDAALMPY